MFQKLSRIICPDFTRNSLTKQSVVQEIPHLPQNPNVQKTRRSPRLFVILRNAHTKRFVCLSPPSTEDRNLWNVQGCFFFSIFKINIPGMCSISVTMQCLGTGIFIYEIQWRRRLTKNYIIIRKKKRRPFRCSLVQMEDNKKTVTSAVCLFVYTTTHCSLKAYCAILVRRSNFRHQASPRVSPRDSTQRRKAEVWARNVR